MTAPVFRKQTCDGNDRKSLDMAAMTLGSKEENRSPAFATENWSWRNKNDIMLFTTLGEQINN